MSVHRSVLVHLASGIGNIVLATPLLIALAELGLDVDVLLDADYADTGDLLADWSVVHGVHRSTPPSTAAFDLVVPAIPPFYWSRFRQRYESLKVVPRPPDRLFYSDEQEYYMTFARALGYPDDRTPAYRLPIAPGPACVLNACSVVIAPGCKTGQMAAKRWPSFPQLAEQFDDVTVVGTRDDVLRADGSEIRFPSHVRSCVGVLTLRETAELMAGAGAVVGNDSGLCHLAAAVGTPTIMLFGPTPHASLGRLASHVRVLRRGLPCEPCWLGAPLAACARRIDCLNQIAVETVAREVRALLAHESSAAAGAL